MPSGLRTGEVSEMTQWVWKVWYLQYTTDISSRLISDVRARLGLKAPAWGGLGFEKPQAEPWAKATARLGFIHGFQE